MFGIKGQITKCIDDKGYPSFVECQFVDVHGCTQLFHDKDVIFTTKTLDKNSNYPVEGIIACEIVERILADEREIIKVNTKFPYHIESTSGETLFEVFANQLIEIQHSKLISTPRFIKFQNNMHSTNSFLQNLYDAFNRREIETVLSTMREDVQWANGMEGGFVYGRDAVREYWRRQFETINPQLEPRNFEFDEANNRHVVTVYQVVQDLDGNVLFDKTVKQIFTLEDGLIKLFEIED